MFKKLYLNENTRIILILSIVFCIIASIVTSIIFIHGRDKSIECINENKEYYLGGEAVGIKLLASGVLVMGVDREDDIIQVGDVILSVNGEKIETDARLEEIAQSGENLKLEVLRGDKKMELEINSRFNETSKKYRLGLWVKDSSAGVGTVTFYEKNSSEFAALGHAITETSLNYILPITSGGITKTQIMSIKKGVSKIPGELKGSISNDTIGQIYINTQNGIFGVVENKEIFENNELIDICPKESIQIGKAYIYVTLDDNKKEKYEIQIEKIFLNSEGNKNMAIKITDKDLLEKTGGIIQGMSGAPIVQNSKLVGAITHVFLDDPTQGYACFIENMIEDMNSI